MSTPQSGRGVHSGPVIALDAMGGDHGPREAVRGAVQAVREHGLSVVLVGRRPELAGLLAEEDAAGAVPIRHAEDTLTMHEGALASWRRPRSSIAVACRLIRQGEASALVSTGSTGGVVTTSTVRLRTQHGIMRPALAVSLPTRPRPTVLLDAGANADAKPEMLVQFAHLGAAYARSAFGTRNPKVAMLTIGAEPGKGNRLARKTADLLTAAAAQAPQSQRLDFRGNVEGHDLLAGEVDVVVTDGFTGNVALKTVEGAVRFTMDAVTEAMTSSTAAKAGAFLQRKGLRELRNRLDSETYGGAVLLGLNASVVIAHGASRAPAVERACRLAHDLTSGGIGEEVRSRVQAGARSARRSRTGSGGEDQPAT
ncbi:MULTISPECIES: phosphate acyltransferase PlsX [Nocardiopsidaceae]|uniref:Phosphate acyltransferase n=1 Tax=Streptomonospora salina TaxID=104205 RepID=A0A841ED13_9ACTN|nr:MULTISPECIES: phosphate acyltransferase PlsX [Nocardiopsaceae]MBB5999209.1 glycerol-3-phosphate acyltransferase PlsX [Streptomonospora salina]